MKELIKSSIKDHSETLEHINQDMINSASDIMIDAIGKGKTIFWCGNGGSASQANHLSGELVGGMYQKKIKPFKSLCLNVDTAFITAWSNDDSFDNIFVRQLEALSESGDVLIVLSTSGNSSNIIKAAEFAHSRKLKVISLTGNDGGVLNKRSDININIPTDSTQRIQEMHILIGHILCDIIEKYHKS
jgi:D-sedoheptulose 7-phosphate isomerase